MQASPAKNEVRLPRAVVERSARIQADLDARQALREPEPSPPALVPVADTPPAPTPPVADPRENDPAYWKQRHKVTEGLLRVEREGRVSDTQASNQRIAELNAQVQTLQAGTPAAPTDLTRFFTPDQIEKYGEEQCRAMATTAEAAADEKIQKAIEAQVKPLADARKADQAAATQAANVRFQDTLTEAYPTWRDVDTTPEWHAWLAQVDESSGLVRQAILNGHGQRHDAARIATMFRQFAESTRVPTPPAAPHGTAGNGGGSAPPPLAAAQGGYPSQSEIKAFFDRSKLGKVKDEERIAFEARLKLRNA